MNILVRDRSDWSEVWLRFRSGDRDAFNKIYEEFVDVLFAYGSKITSDRELLKDCIQDLFYNLHRYNPQLHHPEYLEYYLFRSLKNLIIQKIKKNQLESSLTDEGMFQFDLKFHAEQDAFDLKSDELRVEALNQILKTLDPQKRELLFLKFSTGLNYSEIGHLLNMNPDTAKKQVYRTLNYLRGKFGNKLLELLLVWCKE
ncbi:MAG: sigma-70 family RNA polymerase sigma factor [Bacteroidota bacterium]|nr:sigma-70 family RNA polymerase sigma factor [Bacteroidota bacterium]